MNMWISQGAREIRQGNVCMRSACICQHRHQCTGLMNECVCGAIWDGHAPLLGEISMETSIYTAWLSLLLLLMKLKGGWVLRAMRHCLEQNCGASATSQAAWDGPSQSENAGAKPTSSLVWWFGVKTPCFPALNSVPLSSLPFCPLQLLILLLMARLAKRSHSHLPWSHSNREKVSKWAVLPSGPSTPSPQHLFPSSYT